jgi:hypothetical protein
MGHTGIGRTGSKTSPSANKGANPKASAASALNLRKNISLPLSLFNNNDFQFFAQAINIRD